MTNIIHPLDPSYSKDKDPVFKGGVFVDDFKDEIGKEFRVMVNYAYYQVNDFYQGDVKRIVEYKAARFGNPIVSEERFEEMVRDALKFREGDVIFEVDKMSVCVPLDV
jgi:hypothetical protein